MSDDNARDSLLKRMSEMDSDGKGVVSFITVHDVVDGCAMQKSGKAVGLDGVAMEAFMCGGSRVRDVCTCVYCLTYLSSMDTYLISS